MAEKNPEHLLAT